MKTLFIVSLLSTLLYLLALPIRQHLYLDQATDDLTRGNLEAAQVSVRHVLEEWPNFFTARAQALCGQITLWKAKTLATDPQADFAGAVRLLLGLAERCQGHEEKEAPSLLGKLGALHLTRAAKLCQDREYAEALHEFQDISTLAYPDQLLQEVKNEAAWCRLDYAEALLEEQWFAEALEQIMRVMSEGNTTVRTAALRLVPLVVEKEILYWLGRHQYVKAFDLLDRRWSSFGSEPEVAGFFPRLERHLEIQVFGLVLTQQCVDKPAKRYDEKRSPAATVNFEPGGSATANFTVRNNTPYNLRILLRGPEPADLLLKPQEKKQLWLEPAEYMAGMFSPGNCQVRPKHVSWKIDSFMHHAVEIVPQN